MDTISEILPYAQIALSILLIACILLQQSSSGIGGAFGESNNFSGFNTKRGFEKNIFIATVVIGILFCLSAILALVI